MNFLHPQALHFLWLALIPLALWLFRRKAKRIPVSTLLFFRTLAKEHQESAWLRRLKRLLALLLSLAVIAFATLALSRPYRQGAGDAPRGLIILLDRSASMAAVDGSGRTRLEEAKSRLKAQLQTLPENLVTSLILFDAKVDVVQSRSTNRREMFRLLDQARVVPVEERKPEAVAVARRLAALNAPSEIWLATDEPESAEPIVPSAAVPRVRLVSVALPSAVNVGITGFQIRPAPLSRNRFEAFVEVHASSSNGKSVESSVEARLDGRPVQLRQVELKPGESIRLILPLEGGKGQRLEMEVRTEGDCLGWDDVALAPLPESRSLVVAWLAEAPDPFVELALSSLMAEERIQVLKGGAKDWPLKEKPDVFVFENWLPPAWPTDRPALVLNPPGSVGPVHAKRLEKAVPYDTVRAVQPEHPVLFRVASSRVALSQTTVLNVSDTLETLWMAGSEPVLVAGEAGGQRLVVTAFQPSKSEQLALLSAFPLLVGNALYWCADGAAPIASLKPRRVGEFVEVESGLVKWRAWQGQGFSEVSDEVKSGLLELQRLGVWESMDGKMGASMLLSSHETDVPASKAEKASDERETRWSGGSSWSALLLWSVLAVLLLESWLFHRQAVY